MASARRSLSLCGGGCGLALLLLLIQPVSVRASEPEKDTRLAFFNQDNGDEDALIDEFTFLEDADMVESASRHRQEIGMSPSAVTVLTREDVEASGATNIPDLLRLVPGMDVVIVSPAFSSVTSRMHWTNTNNHYQVLIDGRDAVNELLGHTPWLSETVSLDDVERIEILRGPASSLYGASALAGVISITTRIMPEKTSAAVMLSGGETGVMEVAGRGSTRIGGWGFSLSGTAGISGSFARPRERARNFWKLRSVVEYNWSQTDRLKLDFSAAQAHGGMNSGAGMLDVDFGLRALRLAYESNGLKGRLYWMNSPASIKLEAPLVYGGIRLATFVPIEVDGHVIDGEVQWTLPELAKPLLLIVGGGARAAYLGSDQLLDGDTYADITSPQYHKPGIEHWEGRLGAFAHAEYKPAEWVTVTGSLRFDYNTVTDEFISPRLVAVFKPAKGQYIRLGTGRAFHKPAFVDNLLHPMVEFPPDSPITGPAQQTFQEFMSRVIGNPELENLALLSFEVGYLSQYLDGRLSIAMDLYYNQLRNIYHMRDRIVPDEQGLPDLQNSVMMTENDTSIDIHGFELVVRVRPIENVVLTASWSHKQVLDLGTGHTSNFSPKNLFTLGGRFRTDSGLVGSLYMFSRSEFWQQGIANPEGLLAPSLKMHMPNVILFLGKLGYRWETSEGLDLEIGAKLFLPFSPFSGDYLFSYYEDGGGVSPRGVLYGGEALRRILTGYLQGSF
jgi:outer membrane receptor protein involved in Fe transport